MEVEKMLLRCTEPQIIVKIDDLNRLNWKFGREHQCRSPRVLDIDILYSQMSGKKAFLGYFRNNER